MLGPGPGVEMLTRVTTTTLNTEHWTPRPVTSRWRIGQPGHQGGCLARARTRASQHKRTFPRHSNHPWEISSKAENQWLPVRSHSFMLYLQLDTHLNFSWQTPCFPDSCYLGKDKFPNPGESIYLILQNIVPAMTPALSVLILSALTASVSAECPDGWFHLGEACYLVSREAMTWYNGQVQRHDLIPATIT